MSIQTATELPFHNMARRITKMMDQMQKGYYNFCPGETWTPCVNLYETQTAYLVCVDLAGVEKDKIKIEVVKGLLTVRGTRLVPVYYEGANADAQNRRMRMHVMEIDHGQFCREVELPQNVHHDKIIATYRNGLLWIVLPKK